MAHMIWAISDMGHFSFYLLLPSVDPVKGMNSDGNTLFLDCNGGLVCEDITTCDWQQQDNGEWACVNERVIGRECDGRHDGYSGDDYLGLELELYPDELNGEMITTPYPDSETVQMQVWAPSDYHSYQLDTIDYRVEYSL